MCSRSLDALSACHSLVQILCLVDHSDILNCKLVSRRFRDLIRRNDVTMPRKRLRFLTIHGRTANRNLRPYILVFMGMDNTEQGSTKLSITDDTISFDRSNFMSMERHFKENGAQIKGIAQSNAALDHNSGLRFLLSFLFRRYHFESLTVQNVDIWRDLIAEQFKARRSSCNHAIIYDAWPDIGKFMRDIDFEFTSVYHSAALRILVDVEGIWNRPIFVKFLDFDLANDLFEPVVALVKKWLAGEIRINWLKIQDAGLFVEYFRQEVVSHFDCRPIEGSLGRQFVTRRPSDDVALCFKLGSEIELSDYVYAGPIHCMRLVLSRLQLQL